MPCGTEIMRKCEKCERVRQNVPVGTFCWNIQCAPYRDILLEDMYCNFGLCKKAGSLAEYILQKSRLD